MAPDSGRDSGGSLRRAHVLFASQPAGGSQISESRRKGLDFGGASARGTGEAGEPQHPAGQALLNSRVWHLGSIGFTLNFGMYGMNFWMPQLVKSLSSGASNSLIGLLLMIPHLVGLPVMVMVSRSSDRKQERRYHAAIP